VPQKRFVSNISILKRLGGNDAVKLIVWRFFERIVADQHLRVFFFDINLEVLE
jgi:truncated hemoglobin YjbI